MAKVSSKTIVDAFKHDKCEKCGRAEFADEPGFLGLDSNGVCANCRKPQPSGMQWVKASEPPKFNKKKQLVIKSPLGDLSTTWYFPDTNGLYWLDLSQRGYYWLDESSPSSMQAENERLRKGLRKVIENLSGWEDTDTMMGIAINHAHEALTKQK